MLFRLNLRVNTLTVVKHDVGSTQKNRSSWWQKSVRLALAAAFTLLLGLTGWSDGAGQGHSTDGASGHLPASHLLVDCWMGKKKKKKGFASDSVWKHH